MKKEYIRLFYKFAFVFYTNIIYHLSISLCCPVFIHGLDCCRIMRYFIDDSLSFFESSFVKRSNHPPLMTYIESSSSSLRDLSFNNIDGHFTDGRDNCNNTETAMHRKVIKLHLFLRSSPLSRISNFVKILDVLKKKRGYKIKQFKKLQMSLVYAHVCYTC